MENLFRFKTLLQGAISNLVPRVLWLFGQRMGASRDSGVLEFCYRKISAVKQWKSLQGSQSKNLNFFEFPRVSAGAHPLTKKPEDSGYEIAGVLEFSYRKISAVKQCKPLRGSQSKIFFFFEFSRVSTGAHSVTKKPEDSGYEIAEGVDSKGNQMPHICPGSPHRA